MDLHLLGTAGGPRPSLHRSAPSQAVVHDGQIHVIDAGNGVARQLVAAGLSLDRLAAVYITHHHADHMLDVGALPLIAWTDGRTAPIDIYGPPGLSRTLDHFIEMVRPELDARTQTTGRVDFPSLLRVHEIDEPSVIAQDGALRVTATLVDHPPFPVALAYRFDAPDRSVVISGDTRYCPALAELARDADVLVHEALYEAALDVQTHGSQASSLAEHLLACHTTAEEAGRLAKEAGVQTLVLSHLVPHHATITDEMWSQAASSTFPGDVVVGKDLLKL